MKILLFILISFSLNVVSAKNIRVCPTCDFHSIKNAIAVADSHDIITVDAGTYVEAGIKIDKPLQLIGKGNPIVDGNHIDNIFMIESDSVSISGFVIKNVNISYTEDLAAILIHRCKYFSISNNTLENVFFGILVQKSHNGKIFNNKISSVAKEEYNSGNGIHLWHCSNIEIGYNQTWGLRDGIYFEFVKDSKIHHNHSHNNIRYGLHFMFSNNDTYYDNTFDQNGAGVAVMFSKVISMYRNTFKKNWGTASYGLLLKEIYDAEIVDNVFDENTIGINAEGSNRVNYTKNKFIKNGWAVKVTGACYENIFKQNNFIANAFDISYNGRLNDNLFDENYWGEYTGYDLDKNGIGDVAYRPVKLFSYIVNNTPEAIVLLRSLFVDIINFSEKVSPTFTPDNLIDKHPLMRPVND